VAGSRYEVIATAFEVELAVRPADPDRQSRQRTVAPGDTSTGDRHRAWGAPLGNQLQLSFGNARQQHGIDVKAGRALPPVGAAGLTQWQHLVRMPPDQLIGQPVDQASCQRICRLNDAVGTDEQRRVGKQVEMQAIELGCHRSSSAPRGCAAVRSRTAPLLPS
jgi:hypothetical protein